ncbi:mating-type 1-1 protein [Zymoseptoria brevis]|uniref:Mating-type protein MAT-1 n=1 Tax=Zymoseptoria brevis TaxID=1047168 RepID=A0A0F4G7G8_9PEZI|nr:mating-type 1-1 protein [Zymoseptoria brevis]
MAAAVSSQEMALYLTGCTQEQRDQFNEMLQQINSQASSLNMGTTLVHSGVTKNTKRKGKLTKADLASIGPPKRPLNSWMGYRNFYISLMLGVPQKCVSKTMTLLWSNDPFKAKWALLSKAYSVARGTRAKIDVPLSGFFALCAPLVGIIPPQDYLGMLGWQMTAPRPGENTPCLLRIFTPNFDQFSQHIKYTTLTVDDLVKTCYAAGYVVAEDDSSPGMSAQGSLTMVSKPATTAAAAPKASKPTPAPLGRKMLAKATAALEQTGTAYPYNDHFDPTTQFDVSFNPAAVDTAVEDGGLWNAFTPTAQSGENVLADDVIWSDFIDSEM